MQVQSVSDGSVSLVAQRDIAAGEDITLCYTNPFHGNDRMRRRGTEWYFSFEEFEGGWSHILKLLMCTQDCANLPSIVDGPRLLYNQFTNIRFTRPITKMPEFCDLPSDGEIDGWSYFLCQSIGPLTLNWFWKEDLWDFSSFRSCYCAAAVKSLMCQCNLLKESQRAGAHWEQERPI